MYLSFGRGCKVITINKLGGKIWPLREIILLLFKVGYYWIHLWSHLF